jgi:RNA polymerase sigma-70 factor (ECF subfamily)
VIADADRDLATTSAPGRDERMQQLYDVHARPLYRFLLRLTFGDRLAAEDLMQETLLRAWKKIDGLNTNVATLRPWLLTVARRVAIDAARASQTRPTEVGSLDLGNLPATGDEGERVLAMQVIRQAMAGLSPEHREVIFEVYFRGRSCADTAAVLRIPEGTVKSRTYLALRALRAAMIR